MELFKENLIVEVFPAQAGVFLAKRPKLGKHLRSSPRKRGCFHVSGDFLLFRAVFPAQAGVFPLSLAQTSTSSCLPRASGGVSVVISKQGATFESSPRKRGCFCHAPSRRPPRFVFPAQAGVFPNVGIDSGTGGCLPRASGGVSLTSIYFISHSVSSPRKRGCFFDVGQVVTSRPVFPAQAGVFPVPGRFRSAAMSLPRAGGGVSALDHSRAIILVVFPA